MDIMPIGGVNWNLFIDMLNYRDLFLCYHFLSSPMVLFWSDLKIEIFEGWLLQNFFSVLYLIATMLVGSSFYLKMV
jgi:hypothetical protein